MKNLKNIILFSILGLILLISIVLSFNQKKVNSTLKNDYIEKTDITKIKGSGSVGFGGVKKDELEKTDTKEIKKDELEKTDVTEIKGSGSMGFGGVKKDK